MSRLRRLRALLVVSIVSGIAWIPLGLVVSTIESLVYGRGWIRGEDIPRQLPTLFVLGAVCGFLFAVVLAIGARKRTFEKLTLLRVSAWGALGAAVLPLTLTAADLRPSGLLGMATAVGIYSAVGAVAAGGILLFARRAPAPVAPELAAEEPHRLR